jgi:hypothetical protein
MPSILHTQNILKDVKKKYDFEKTQQIAIKKTIKFLNIHENKNLSSISYCNVSLSKSFDKNTNTIDGFLNSLELDDKEPISYVYNDSLNIILSVVDKKYVLPPSTNPNIEYTYIQYFREFSDEK